MDRHELLKQLIENLQGMYRGMLHKSDYHKDGIPFGQKAALFAVDNHKAVNVKQLATMLHITSGAATQHVEALVHEGLVERTTDQSDRRNVIIVATSKGKSLIKKMAQNRTRMMEELFQDISDQELIAFNSVMEKVNNKLKQQEETKHD